MSPLATRPGRNAARQAKKLSEIRHVKGAIRWAERTRKERQKKALERLEHKQMHIGAMRWEWQNVTSVRQRALRNAREDWMLGPLRPNRAIGAGREKYGALNARHAQKAIQEPRVLARENDQREKRGQEVKYPLIVDEKKYFPIVAGDRVTVVRGRSAGCVGIVRDVVGKTHDVVIDNVNKHYYDSSIFNRGLDEDIGPKRANEASIPMADVRLVVPYATTSYNSYGAEGLTSVQDVVVDKIYLERHTTGIDPFTGTDYGDAEIPAKHQYDPHTGLPIFHRYIAGTRHRLEWPWEKKEAKDSSKITEEKTDRKTWLGKTLGTLRHPITTLQQWTSTKDDASKLVESESGEPVWTQLEELEAERQQKLRTNPRSNVVKSTTYDIDTTRNIVEGAESMSYTLVAPPFPESLGAELRGDIHDFAIDARKDKEDPYNAIRPKRTTPEQQAALAFAKEKKRAALKMKTPMQLRWEAEAAKKKATAPLVDTDTLLRALGKHMIKSQPKRKASKTAKPEELD